MRLRWFAGLAAVVLILAIARPVHAEPVPSPVACLPQPEAVTVAAIGTCIDELRATTELVLAGELPMPESEPVSVCTLDVTLLTEEAVGACLAEVRDGTAADAPIGTIFEQVAGWATGNTGRGLATIAITVVGIGALLGKVSWGMALIVGLGVAAAFGAGGIVSAFGIPPVPPSPPPPTAPPF